MVVWIIVGLCDIELDVKFLKVVVFGLDCEISGVSDELKLSKL